MTIGNGTTIMVKGKGDVNIFAFNGKDWTQKQIKDVLFVPEIHLNLFSSGKVMDRGHQLRKANSKRCEILKDGSIVAVGVRRDALYQMLFKVEEISINDTAIANVAMKKFSLRTWHERMGHQNVAHVKKYLRNNGIDFMDQDFTCEACVYGKHHRGSFKLRDQKSTTCGAIIHADVCGPMHETSIGGSRYFLLLKDDYSHFRVVYFLKQKSEVAGNVKNFVRQMQNMQGHNVRIFRSDNGGESVNNELKGFFDEMGIHYQRAVAYTPEQNGCAEREMRTIVESARTMIHAKKMELKFWAEAVNSAVYVLNRTGTSTVPDISPHELWFGSKAKIEHLRIFGSDVFVHVPKEKRRKLDPKAIKCIFVGYDNHSKAYRVWDPNSKKVEVVRDVIFLLEESMNIGDNQTIQGNTEMYVTPDNQMGRESDTETNAEVYVTPNNQMGREGGALCDLDNQNVIGTRLRDRTNIMTPERLTYIATADHTALLADNDEPNTYEQAMESIDHKEWEKAMDEEYDSLIKNRTWILVKAPVGQKIIDNR